MVASLADAAKAVSRGFWIFPCNPVGTICPETGKNIEKMSHLIRPDRRFKMRWGEAATNDQGIWSNAGGTLTVVPSGRGVAVVDAQGNQSVVTIATVNQSNGVIHVVDTVLLPPSE